MRGRRKTHGMTHSSTWNSYTGAKSRCEYLKAKSYSNYGGRGIKFKFKNFQEFFACLGLRPKKYTLDRIDNDGDYEPGNVRWTTPKEQRHNSRRKLHARGSSKGYGCKKRPWRATIVIKEKQHFLGNFATELKAHKAYLRARRELV